jgi:hypothetical protein
MVMRARWQVLDCVRTLQPWTWTTTTLSLRRCATLDVLHRWMLHTHVSLAHSQRSVPASMRGEQLQRIVLHYIMYLSEWWRSEMPEPAFVRLGRVGELPAVEDITEAAAEEGEPVQSRRHDGDTPSVLLTAHEAKAKARTRPEQVARYELYREAIEYVDALLTQYYDEKKVRTKS